MTTDFFIVCIEKAYSFTKRKLTLPQRIRYNPLANSPMLISLSELAVTTFTKSPRLLKISTSLLASRPAMRMASLAGLG